MGMLDVFFKRRHATPMPSLSLDEARARSGILWDGPRLVLTEAGVVCMMCLGAICGHGPNAEQQKGLDGA